MVDPDDRDGDTEKSDQSDAPPVTRPSGRWSGLGVGDSSDTDGMFDDDSDSDHVITMFCLSDEFDEISVSGSAEVAPPAAPAPARGRPGGLNWRLRSRTRLL
jgi:hypothetical protein